MPRRQIHTRPSSSDPTTAERRPHAPRPVRCYPAPSSGWSCCCRSRPSPAAVTTPPAALGTPTPDTAGGASPIARARASGATGVGRVEDRHRRRPRDTRYGPVQVQITVANGTVTSVTAVDYPQNDPRDVADQLLRDPAAQPGGDRGEEREHRHGLRRHVHQPGLHPVAAERAGPGGPVTAADRRPHRARRALHGHRLQHRRPRPRRLDRRDRRRRRLAAPRRPGLQHVPGRTATSAGCSAGRSGCAEADPLRRRGARPVRGAWRSPPADTSRPGAAAGSTRPGWSRAGRSRARAGGCACAARPTTRSTAAATSSWPARPSPVACGRSGSPTRTDPAGSWPPCRGADLAVATSGTAERGAHILDPFTGRPVTHLASATVTGPELSRVDAYATAAFVHRPLRAAAGSTGIPGHAALLVDPDGRRHASADWSG